MEYLQYLPLWYIYYIAGRRARLCWRSCFNLHLKLRHHSTIIDLTEDRVHSVTPPPQPHHSSQKNLSKTLLSHLRHSKLLRSHYSNTHDSNKSHLLSSQLRNLHSEQTLSNEAQSSLNSQSLSLHPEYANSKTHLLHSDFQQCEHSNTLSQESLHSDSLNSKWRLAALCAVHAHIVAPALCVFVVTAFRDSGVDHRVVKGMLLASAGGPCGWLSLALWYNTTNNHEIKCSNCDMRKETEGTNYCCNNKTDEEKIYSMGANSKVSDNNRRFSIDMFDNSIKNVLENTKRVTENNESLYTALTENNKVQTALWPLEDQRAKTTNLLNASNHDTKSHDCGLLTPLLVLANYVTALIAVPALMIVICGQGTIPNLGGIISDALNTIPQFILGALLAAQPKCRCSEKSVKSETECNRYTAVNFINEDGASHYRKRESYGTCEELNNFKKGKNVNDSKINYKIQDGVQTIDNCRYLIDNDSESIIKHECPNKTNCDNDSNKTLNFIDKENLNGISNNVIDIKVEENSNKSDKFTEPPDNIDKNSNKLVNSKVKNHIKGKATTSNLLNDSSSHYTTFSSLLYSNSSQTPTYSRMVNSQVLSRLCGLMLVYCECCDRLREVEGSLYVGDLLLTLVLALCWLFASACFCLVYARVSRDHSTRSHARLILVCALPKCFHAGWVSSGRCTAWGLSLLPAALLAPAQALLLAAVITHTEKV